MQEFIVKLRQKKNLTQDEMAQVIQAIMLGSASQEDMAQFLLALNEKGPSVDELTGAAKVMREFVLEVKTDREVVVDTCGTGGDQKNTFNISTVVGFVVAGAGVTVAKHGNRSVSSRCGSADLLEALGVNLGLNQQQLSDCLKEVGIAFLFAQKLHPAMKNVAPVRKALGVKTIFNILGPLTNPANATHQMIGIYSRELVEPMIHVLRNLGLKRALVVHGNDGLDEITTTSTSTVAEWNGKKIVMSQFDPKEVEFPLAKPEDLLGGDVVENAKTTMGILQGVAGPKRDIVILNAAFVLYLAGLAKNISAGVKIADEVIDSGRARQKLEELIKFTTQIS